MDCAELERVMRKNLNMSSSSKVKPVVTEAARESAEPPEKRARWVVPDSTGSVQFDKLGKAEETHYITTARMAGLCVDVRAQTTKMRGVICGALGTTKQVGKTKRSWFSSINKASKMNPTRKPKGTLGG